MDGPVAANPKFRSGRGYQDNCTNCVAAMEYRMRGYNVTAAPMQGGRTVAEMARRWKHGNGDLVGQHEMTKVRGKAELNASLKELPDGARFVVQFMWSKGNFGHIIYGTKKRGKVRLFDPQNKTEVPTTGQYWQKVDPLMRVLRIDGLELVDPKEDLTW
jgi:hypothetical protein